MDTAFGWAHASKDNARRDSTGHVVGGGRRHGDRDRLLATGVGLVRSACSGRAASGGANLYSGCLHVVVGLRSSRFLEAALLPHCDSVIRDVEYEFQRTPIPRPRVNRGAREQLFREHTTPLAFLIRPRSHCPSSCQDPRTSAIRLKSVHDSHATNLLHNIYGSAGSKGVETRLLSVSLRSSSGLAKVSQGRCLGTSLPNPLPERVWKYQIEGDVARRRDWEIPVWPFVGTIGTSPATGAISSLSPGDRGSNMGVPDTRIGNTVYLPVRPEGGLLRMSERASS